MPHSTAVPLAKDPNASAYARAACSWALAGDNRMMLMELERMSPAHLDELSLRICVLVSHAMELAESLQPSLPHRLASLCGCGAKNCTDRVRVCAWCEDPDCADKDNHSRLDAMSETTWRRRARA